MLREDLSRLTTINIFSFDQKREATRRDGESDTQHYYTIPTLAADKDQKKCGVLEAGAVHDDGGDDSDDDESQ